MTFQLKEGHGSLGTNRYPKGDNSPTITGKFMLYGKLHYINGWKKMRDDGGTWYSLSVKPADDAAQVPPQQDDDPGF